MIIFMKDLAGSTVNYFIFDSIITRADKPAWRWPIIYSKLNNIYLYIVTQ